MCGRYYIEGDDAGEIAEQAAARAPQGAQMKRSGEIFPGDLAPVLAPDKDRRPSGFCMRWGYTGQKGLIFNARSETALTRPMFRDGMLHRRCLIPLSRYFEWEKRENGEKGGGRLRYALWPEGDGPFYLAGLYRLEGRLPVFTVLTRAPAPPIAFMHDRMPVLLSGREMRLWLDPTADPAEPLSRAWTNIAFRPDP